MLFYSRRIGLTEGSQVPIQGGGRLSGRVGKTSVGVLDIRADDFQAATTALPATNFAVVRVKQDILRRSSIGAALTQRSDAIAGPGSNQAYGLDANLAFFTNLSISTYWARTRTEGLDGDDESYRAQLDYAGDRYGVQTEYLRVGDNFNPEVGFVRRDDMKRAFTFLRFSPRPRSMPSHPPLHLRGVGRLHRERAGLARNAGARRPVRPRLSEQRPLQRDLHQLVRGARRGRSRSTLA